MNRFIKFFKKSIQRLRNNYGFATLVADNATNDQAGGPSVIVPGLKDARVKACLDSYTIGGSTETSGSTIDVGALLPANAHVVAIGLHVSTNQTSLTVSIGDDASATRYASASTSLQTAGFYWYSGKNYVVGTSSGDNQIVLTTGGATMTAGQLEVVILYTMD